MLCNIIFESNVFNSFHITTSISDCITLCIFSWFSPEISEEINSGICPKSSLYITSGFPVVIFYRIHPIISFKTSDLFFNPDFFF